MQVDLATLHLRQPFTEKYVLALGQYQNQGNELPEFLFVAIQTEEVLGHLPLGLPFSKFAEGVWVRLGSLLEDYEAYRSDPESAQEAWYYAIADHIISSDYDNLHATGIWK